jgi:hypothetical protein
MEEHIILKALRYRFSDAELKLLSRELARKYDEAAENEHTKKRVMADLKADAERLEGEIGKLSRQVRDEYEIRDIKCRLYFNDPVGGKKSTYRTDDGSLVETMEMEQFEKQEPLPFEQPPAPQAPIEDTAALADALKKLRGRPRKDAAPVEAPTAEEREDLDRIAEDDGIPFDLDPDQVI